MRFESLRTVIGLSVKQGLKLHQMDLTAAFLNRDLDEEVYMGDNPRDLLLKDRNI